MIHTDDLFLGAYVLMRGGRLEEVVVRGMNGRRTAVFRIEGVEEAKQEYWSGCVSVNLPLLKLEVRRLKDRAFEAIRAKAKEERRHAGGHEERDRAHQTSERPRRDRHRARD